ncbi:MAG: hypothetical protein M1830_000470, partial [Pleopsidium flavum]
MKNLRYTISAPDLPPNTTISLGPIFAGVSKKLTKGGNGGGPKKDAKVVEPQKEPRDISDQLRGLAPVKPVPTTKYARRREKITMRLDAAVKAASGDKDEIIAQLQRENYTLKAQLGT